MAAQIGVNKDTIYNWEMNRAAPEVQFIPAIINFLGHAPYDPKWSFGQRLRAIRSALGLPQEQFASEIGVDESTVAKWEREEHRPTRRKRKKLLKFFQALR